MPRNERRILIRLGRLSGDPDTAVRFRTVALLGSGRSGSQTARDLEIARSTVVRAAQRFVAEGIAGLLDRRGRNGTPKADEPFRRRVASLLRGSPEDFGWCRPTWTRELLCLQMQRDGWPAVAVCTMGRALARIGARLGTLSGERCHLSRSRQRVPRWPPQRDTPLRRRRHPHGDALAPGAPPGRRRRHPPGATGPYLSAPTSRRPRSPRALPKCADDSARRRADGNDDGGDRVDQVRKGVGVHRQRS
ncbi:MAG: helix-turn-helix domain-containing protein [Polyangiaceae bacterium]